MSKWNELEIICKCGYYALVDLEYATFLRCPKCKTAHIIERGEVSQVLTSH